MLKFSVIGRIVMIVWGAVLILAFNQPIIGNVWLVGSCVVSLLYRGEK